MNKQSDSRAQQKFMPINTSKTRWSVRAPWPAALHVSEQTLLQLERIAIQLKPDALQILRWRLSYSENRRPLFRES